MVQRQPGQAGPVVAAHTLALPLTVAGLAGSSSSLSSSLLSSSLLLSAFLAGAALTLAAGLAGFAGSSLSSSLLSSSELLLSCKGRRAGRGAM